jgi:predicted nucleic acid-binding protein
MKTYVVDASVILKWVIGDAAEPDQGLAISLLNTWMTGDLELVAPTLWKYEVGNFLGRQLPDNAIEKMDILFGLQIRTLDLTPDMYRRCFRWMKIHGITFYDAAYLAVACELPGILVTADKKFADKIKQPEHICLLQDIEAK